MLEKSKVMVFERMEEMVDFGTLYGMGASRKV